jgi:phenylacetate-CoA oxygenase PaaH subunit
LLKHHESKRSTTTPPNGRFGKFLSAAKQGLDHKHVGSLHAVDAQMAIENARDVYTRRMEGVSIWAVESKHIHASNPAEGDSHCMILQMTKHTGIRLFMTCLMN